MTTDHPEYETVEVPPTRSPADLSYVERRAELLQHIRNAGHPGHINKSALASHYGVARQTIHRDFERLKEYHGDLVDEAQARMETELVYEQSIRKLQEQNRPKEAARVARWQWQYYVESGIVDTDNADSLHGDVDAENVAYYVDYDGDLDEDDIPRNPDGSIDYGELGFSSGPERGEDQDAAPGDDTAETDTDAAENDEQAATDGEHAGEDGGGPAGRSAMDAFESAADDEHDPAATDPDTHPEERDDDSNADTDDATDGDGSSCGERGRGERGERGRGHR